MPHKTAEARRLYNREYKKRWNERHPGRKAAYMRKHYQANKVQHTAEVLRNKLKRKYGLTLDEYNQLLQDQNGQCAVCHTSDWGNTRWGTVKRATVDHNHLTGKVRGLLCTKCNVVLGLFDDDTNRFVSAIAYLKAGALL
jgi:hypothetical protein